MEAFQKYFQFVDAETLQTHSFLEFVIFDGKYFDVSAAISTFQARIGDLSPRPQFSYSGEPLLVREEGDGSLKFYIQGGEDLRANQIIIIDHENKKTEEDTEKKQRSKERTVAEVLVGVKKWRQLSNNKNRWEKKLSLQDAAKELGFNKKTLDDYYSYLRLAESLGFDFEQNLNEKVGILRNYVKTHRKFKNRQKRKHQKLPKQLLILQTLNLSNVFISLPKNPSEISSIDEQQIPELQSNKFSGEQTDFCKTIFSNDPWVVDKFISLSSQNQIKPFSLDFLDIL